jgi:hypothetical protein
MRSFLVTDLGIANSRTVYIDVVEGQYRLIAAALTRTTTALPDGDVQIGVRRNLEQIQELTEHPLLKEGFILQPTQVDGSGFDEFIATASSAGRPLQAVLVALMDDVSLVSAARALTGTYVEIVETLTLIDIQTEEQRINVILHDRPDMILIAGGTNDGNEDDVRDLIRLVELAVKLLPEDHRPIVLYAGNERLASWAKARLDDDCLVLTADNLRPALGVENLDSAKRKLAQVFDSFLKRQPGGFTEVSGLAKTTGIIPTAQSASYLVRYLDGVNEAGGAMYLDIGSGSSILLTSLDGDLTSNIQSNLGLGYSVEGVLKALDWRDVERWLPFQFSREALAEWVYNKALAPNTLPQTLRDLFIEQAVAREIGAHLLEGSWPKGAPNCSPIILGGGIFTGGVPPRMSAMLAMDALQPAGMVDIWLDSYALVPALGALSLVEPVATVQVVDSGGFVRLGTAFAPTGRRARLGGGRMRVKLTLPNGEVIQHNVGFGELWIPHLPAGVWVDVVVRVPRGFSLNGRRRFSGRVQTGAAGLIFDMRNRPIAIPSGRRRPQTIANWFTAATDIPVDLEQLQQAQESVDQMAVLTGTLSETDFPAYDRLPNTVLSDEFAALLGTSADSDTTASEEEDFDALARELGLR